MTSVDNKKNIFHLALTLISLRKSVSKFQYLPGKIQLGKSTCGWKKSPFFQGDKKSPLRIKIKGLDHNIKM